MVLQHSDAEEMVMLEVLNNQYRGLGGRTELRTAFATMVFLKLEKVTTRNVMEKNGERRIKSTGGSLRI